MAARKRPVLEGPAFSLAHVEAVAPDVVPVQCAAKCLPMSEILPHVFLGSWRDMHDPELLKAQRVTHILNVAREVDPQAHEERLSQFVTLHIPLVDEHRENIDRHIDTACAFIEQARAAEGRVLVHCRRGISRSPAIVVGYLMKHAGFRYESALDFTKTRRACVSLNMAFRDFLERLDEALRSGCAAEAGETKTECIGHETASVASFAREGSGIVGAGIFPSPGCSSRDSTFNEGSRFPAAPTPVAGLGRTPSLGSSALPSMSVAGSVTGSPGT